MPALQDESQAHEKSGMYESPRFSLSIGMLLLFRQAPDFLGDRCHFHIAGCQQILKLFSVYGFPLDQHFCQTV